MAFKCHLCKKVYMNNIEFMKHLSLHVETDRASAVDLVSASICLLCLTRAIPGITLAYLTTLNPFVAVLNFPTQGEELLAYLHRVTQGTYTLILSSLVYVRRYLASCSS